MGKVGGRAVRLAGIWGSMSLVQFVSVCYPAMGLHAINGSTGKREFSKETMNM